MLTSYSTYSHILCFYSVSCEVLHAKLKPFNFDAIRRCLKIWNVCLKRRKKTMFWNKCATKKSKGDEQRAIASNENGQRKLNRFYARMCVHFHDFRLNCDELLEFRRKLSTHTHKTKSQNTRKCYSTMLFTNINFLVRKNESGRYGNTKQMQCVWVYYFWDYFRSNCASLCMHRQANELNRNHLLICLNES